uniref:VQ domain-containing protein n=1 Tax=Cucumis melo TaxID=3656 RepID=A0A9I9CSF5_CUCME
MDAFCAYTSSSSSSSSSFLAKKNDQSEHQIVKREFSTYSNNNNNIHCVRKPMAKPWKKPAIAPLPPTRPRVYKVDPINFRGLVQKLTGLAELRSPRLQKMAPPPLDISRRQDACSAAVEDTVFKASPLLKVENEAVDGGGFLELNLSPFNKNWCSFPALSPETLAILDAI